MAKNEKLYQRILELSKSKISKKYAGQILFNEKLVKSPEAGRHAIRSYTGAMGSENRENYKHVLIDWETGIPEPEPTEYGVHDIDCEKGIACLFDIHLPFHDLDTINEVIERQNEYDVLVIQEVFDFYALSKFTKTKELLAAQEQEMWFQFADHLKKHLPTHRIIFQQGNHDERYKIYLWQSAQAVANMVGMSFREIMDFEGFDIELIPERNLLKYRSLFIGHGHELGVRSGGVNPARTFFLKTNGNFIGGHLHKTSEHIARNINDDVKGCWSVGCACELHPAYMPVNQWNNGYAIIRPSKQHNFRVENVKIF